MKSLLVQLDDQTYQHLNRVAPAASRGRSRFIREAIRTAIREAEYRAMREAYRRQPDSEAEADDWSTPEEFRKVGICFTQVAPTDCGLGFALVSGVG